MALQEFERHPLLGIGQDNFAASYLRYRKTDQEPRWTHSLELRLLTHTGLVGALLFGVFLGAIFLGCLRHRREAAREHTIAVATALLPLIVWLVHGSIDWLWEFPALSVPALAFAGAAIALGGTPRSPQQHDYALVRRSGTKTTSRGLLAATCVCASLAWVSMLLVLGLPFVAARKVQGAIAVYSQRPALAYAELRSASKLMPFDDQIYLVAGAIGLNLEQPATARAWLAEAQLHDDQGWLAPFLLGLIEGEEGRAAQARAQLVRARALNPSEPIVAQALARLHSAHPMTFLEAQRMLASRSEERFGH